MDVDIDQDLVEILQLLKKVSLQPFKGASQMPMECSLDNNMDIAYFPTLPIVRARGKYSIDKNYQLADSCRKTSSRHPTLLPGIFTLFCQHGNLIYTGYNVCILFLVILTYICLL